MCRGQPESLPDMLPSADEPFPTVATFSLAANDGYLLWRRKKVCVQLRNKQKQTPLATLRLADCRCEPW